MKKEAALLGILLLLKRRRRRRGNRTMWLRTWIKRSEEQGAFNNLIRELASENKRM